MADLSQETWSEQLKECEDGVILDVRTEREVSKGIIPNAIHIDIYRGQEFLDEIENLDKSKHYFVYCKSGGRSAQACSIMNQLGFDHTFNLVGGITKWRGALTSI